MAQQSADSGNTYEQIVQRNYGVYSLEQQKSIRSARVAVVGIGCDGGLAAIILTRIGVGSITLIDPDVVEISNLNRQPLCTMSMLGMKKVDAARVLLAEYNPHVQLNAVDIVVTEKSKKILEGHDVILQCVDNFLGRIAVHRVARELGTPVVSMTGQPPYRAHVSTFFKEGPEYEVIWGFPSLSKPLDGAETEILLQMKKERARRADARGASAGWCNAFMNGLTGWGGEPVGWAITPERAYITATIQAHEAVNVITKRAVLAQAPSAIIIDLSTPPNIVRVVGPPCTEQWDFRAF